MARCNQSTADLAFVLEHGQKEHWAGMEVYFLG